MLLGQRGEHHPQHDLGAAARDRPQLDRHPGPLVRQPAPDDVLARAVHRRVNRALDHGVPVRGQPDQAVRPSAAHRGHGHLAPADRRDEPRVQLGTADDLPHLFGRVPDHRTRLDYIVSHRDPPRRRTRVGSRSFPDACVQVAGTLPAEARPGYSERRAIQLDGNFLSRPSPPVTDATRRVPASRT